MTKELFEGNPGMLEYAKAITDEYNRWDALSVEAVNSGMVVEQGIAAFHCNAISTAMIKSGNADVREYFYRHANAA